MANVTTETKAQKVERLKREKNPWEGLDEIRRFSREGFGSIPPEWVGTYFKWWGVYTQGDGAGVLGGKGGEGKAVPYLMLRIRIPNGLLLSHQLRTIASVAERYARGVADLTVRQNVQLHWLTIEDLPNVLEALWRAGLTTIGSCGDDTRNITGCPLTGVDADEIADTSALALEVNQYFVGNADFYNLPRKFKVCITGCRVWCAYPEINDVGFTAIQRPAVRRTPRAEPETGFSVRIGGGLSTNPHLALRLNAFVRWQQVLPVLKGVAEIFRDSDKLRENRERARLKFLFLQQGWTADSFQEELEKRIGFALDPAVPEEAPADVYRDHVGIHPQKQDGYSYVGAGVLRGRITPEQLHAVADLSDRYANGQVRITVMQNLLIVNVPKHNTDKLANELRAVGLPVAGSSFFRGAVACTGSEFCKLAITETKGFARWVVEELEERLPGFEQHLKLHVTGCPNSCGQHWIADIGLEGKKIKTPEGMRDAYYFCVGGAVGLHQSIARPVGYRCLASEVPASIERLLRQYLDTRLPDENLRAYFARHSEAELRQSLAGEIVIPVERDPAEGRIPHTVEG